MAISQSQSHAKYIKTEIRQQKLMNYMIHGVCPNLKNVLTEGARNEMMYTG